MVEIFGMFVEDNLFENLKLFLRLFLREKYFKIISVWEYKE